MTDVYDVVTKEKKDTKTEIHYQMPRFHRRVFAKLLDLIFFLLCFGLCFLASREIVTTSAGYQKEEETYLAIQQDSGLYKTKEDGTVVDVVTYWKGRQFSGSERKNGAVQAIDTFFTYAENKVDSTTYQTMVENYRTYRLTLKDANETAYFITDSNDKVIENPDLNANDQTYFEVAYAPYIDDTLQGYLLTKIPGYLELQKYESQTLIWAEIVPAYAIAGFLIYFLPPLCFRRSHYTFGRGLYHIGIAGPDLLSVRPGRMIIRQCIVYFALVIGSLFLLGVPLILSFSLMAFSKKKQDFPDYMLNCHEVDLSRDKLYLSFEEIRMSQISVDKKGPDFHVNYPE